MKARRRILITILLLDPAGIVWGYLRLPWAVVRSLYRDDDIAKAPAVYLSPKLAISSAQRRDLRQALPVRVVPTVPPRSSFDALVPRVSVSVTWNWLVIARVESAVFTQDKHGVTGRDSVYVCLFGAWFPILTYRYDSGWPPDAEALAPG
jgi:hypothetical protein